MKTVPPTNHPVGPPDWRETPTHPLAADLFPLDDADAKPAKDLADSISRHGLLESIKLWQGQVIDGRRRFRACLALDIKPRFEDIDLADDEAALSAVVSLNTERRKRLSRAQRDEMIVRLRQKGLAMERIVALLHISKTTAWKVIKAVTNASTDGTSVFPTFTLKSDGTKQPAQRGQAYPDIWRLRSEGRTYKEIQALLGVSQPMIARALKAQKAAEAKAAEQPAPSSREQQPDQATPEPLALPVQSVATGKPTLADVEYAAEVTDLPLDVREVVIGWVIDRLEHAPDDAPLDIAQAFVDGFLEGAKVAIEHLTVTPKAPTPIKTKSAAKSKAKQVEQLVGAALTDAAAYGAAS